MPLERITVSVVIPCYNSESFVAESIASVFGQTYPLEEIICVDDGSTDGTLEVLRQVQAQSEGRITVLTGPNGGPSVARNRGVAVASGDYIQFLDSDDLLLPDKIEHQVGLIEAREVQPDLVAATYKKVFLYKDKEEIVDVHSDPWVGLVVGRLGITSANLYCREAVRRVGGWNEDRLKGEDTELAFRLLDLRQSVVLDTVPKTTLRRRIDSHWRVDLRSSLRGWVTIRMVIVARMQERGLLTRERKIPVEQAVFRTIRAVYKYDQDLAAAAFEAMISSDFRPAEEEHGRVYRFLFSVCGFGWAQQFHPYWIQVGRLRTLLRERTLGCGNR